MNEEFISVKELAVKIGMDRSHARRYVRRLGIEPTKRRDPGSGNQPTLTVSRSEADFIMQRRAEQGFGASSKEVQNDNGFFYIIQLVPELDARRVKLGFADDVNVRLLQHRTAAPTAVLVKAWPCKRSWESTVIDALAFAGGRLILNEVYEFEDFALLVTRADQIFSILPGPGYKAPLSEASPYLPANDRETGLLEADVNEGDENAPI